MRGGLLRVHRKAFRTFNFGPENESESELSLLSSASDGGGGRALFLLRSRIPTYIRTEEEEGEKNFVKLFIRGQKLEGGGG